MFKKFISRKFLVVVASNVASLYLLSKGIDVSAEEIQTVGNAVINSGDITNALIVIGQAWVNKKYVESQAQVDAVGMDNELTALKEVILGD